MKKWNKNFFSKKHLIVLLLLADWCTFYFSSLI